MEPHEEWAKHPDVLELLRFMLSYPEADHSIAVAAVLRGELCVAHAYGLYRASKHFDAAKWSSTFTGNRGVAFHLWLYHFLGGANGMLRAPSIGHTAECMRMADTADEAMCSQALPTGPSWLSDLSHTLSHLNVSW